MKSKQYILSLLLFTLLFLLPSLNLSLSPPQPERCYPDDKRALLELKAYFGNNVSVFSTWSPETDCCNKWNGVQCKKIPKTQIRRVNFLEIFDSDDVVGTIPSTLEKLPYLETLTLRVLPNLTGPIPPAIGKLTNLDFLSLSWDSLSGPIPHFLNRLTKLLTLRLDNNHFTGSIPPFIGRLPHFEELDLSNNHLTGSIPRSLGKVNYGIIDFSGNELTGDASFLFGEDKTNADQLMLSWNRLSFDMSKVVMPVGRLNSSLTWLDLSHNQIYGRLPSWLGQAFFLGYLDVSFNRLCGPIPTAGGNLQSFAASLFAHNKCLCGSPLPPCNS